MVQNDQILHRRTTPFCLAYTTHAHVFASLICLRNDSICSFCWRYHDFFKMLSFLTNRSITQKIIINDCFFLGRFYQKIYILYFYISILILLDEIYYIFVGNDHDILVMGTGKTILLSQLKNMTLNDVLYTPKVIKIKFMSTNLLQITMFLLNLTTVAFLRRTSRMGGSLPTTIVSELCNHSHL